MSKTKSKNYFHCGLWWTNGARIILIIIVLFLIALLKKINSNSNKNKNTTGQQHKRDTDKTV